MASQLVEIKNYKQALEKARPSLSGANDALLQRAGDYSLAAVSLPAGQRQKPHYHTYADIDIFTVTEGGGYLHLAKVEKDRVVPGSEEKIALRHGDTYAVKPYTLHGLEAGDEGITVINIAPDAHRTSVEGENNRRSIDLFFPTA